MARNNGVVRELARSRGMILAETEVLADQPEFFMDDCHMHPAGHRRQAEIIAAELSGAERCGWTASPGCMR